MLQQFVTVRWMTRDRLADVVAAVATMSLIYDANTRQEQIFAQADLNPPPADSPFAWLLAPGPCSAVTLRCAWPLTRYHRQRAQDDSFPIFLQRSRQSGQFWFSFSSLSMLVMALAR